ncbi:putative HTH cro/C1-type domain-containing protein [Clostridium neonatale]|uniref:helix-turn-helix domain-containing protein n=1 Tax=Clostridium neonatale TaxID=137838 RepID=UPI00291BFF74|nr:helix-turn-helix transcriptional regulator [Clostridium neonatale]CAI3664476.1 putative HTH cro/C1-type domain-containing protein [Clostridium neonatale]
MSIGDNIKKYRKLNKLTQKELGEKIGKKAITVRHYESGDTNPPTSVLIKIGEVLNVSTEKLINDSGSEISLPPVTSETAKLVEKALGIVDIEYTQEEKEALALTDALNILLKRNGYDITSFSASEADVIIKNLENLVVLMANLKEKK